MKKIRAKVVPGRGVGRQLNFPTLNFEIPEKFEVEFGVFATRLFFGGKIFPAILFFGNRRTFDGVESLEIHILEKFPPAKTEVADSPTSAEFEILEKIREVRKFDSPEKLRAQIEKDCAIAKKILNF